jgi:hypothetical protein
MHRLVAANAPPATGSLARKAFRPQGHATSLSWVQAGSARKIGFCSAIGSKVEVSWLSQGNRSGTGRLVPWSTTSPSATLDRPAELAPRADVLGATVPVVFTAIFMSFRHSGLRAVIGSLIRYLSPRSVGEGLGANGAGASKKALVEPAGFPGWQACRLPGVREREQGLTALVNPPVTAPLCPRYPHLPFIAKAEPPKDGFGEAFVYESDASGFRLVSPGRERWYEQKGRASTSCAVDAGYPQSGINLCF